MTHPSVHAAVTPDKIAYRMAGSGETLSFRQLDERSNQTAQLLRALGLGVGDHVAVMMENCLAFMEICWGAQRSGLYYTAISRFLKADEIAFIVQDSGARVLVLSEVTLDHLGADGMRAMPPGVVIFSTGAARDGVRSWRAAVDAMPSSPIGDEIAGADMLYSSGTTGRPKGVKQALKMEPITTLHPLLKLLMVDMIGMSGASVYLSPAPLYHAAPLRFSMVAAALGASVVIMEKFDAGECLRLIEAWQISHAQFVPTMFVRILKLPDSLRRGFDLSSLRGAVHAAAPCPAEVKQRMIDWWGPILVEYYAGTEANGVTVINAVEWAAHRGSVGRALLGRIMILNDENGDVLPAGEIGSVYFADGPQFAYHNNPEMTARAHNEKGWSTLGDVGYLDADGYLHLTDRKAYMIISGGVNIYPQEAEDVLITHPDVMDVAVFGVPDAEMGEAVKAIVQLIDPAQASAAMAAALMDYCRARLSAVKCPRSVEFSAELPRTPTGKLMKRLLRDRYWV